MKDHDTITMVLKKTHPILSHDSFEISCCYELGDLENKFLARANRQNEKIALGFKLG